MNKSNLRGAAIVTANTVGQAQQAGPGNQAAAPASIEPPSSTAEKNAAVEYAWDDLTEDEVLKSKDHRQKRSSQARGNYAFTRDDVDQEIKKLFG